MKNTRSEGGPISGVDGNHGPMLFKHGWRWTGMAAEGQGLGEEGVAQLGVHYEGEAR